MISTDIAIAGAGPAGLTAGIYAARSGHKVLLIEKSFAGGQMAMTSEVENYPGFSEPVNGMLLAQTMERQALRFGCQMLNGEVTSLSQIPAGYELTTTAEKVTAKSLVICTGVKPRQLGVPGERELVGRGVSYCAVCDGPLFRNREVAVVGGGDSALDEAVYLANIASRVHIIHRRDQFRACQMAQERARRQPNVVFHLSRVIKAIEGGERLQNLKVQDLKTGAVSDLAVTGLFVYVGWIPNTAWCRDLVRLDDSGNIVTDEHLRTSRPGIFAAGDVRNTPLRQVATAVGDGALAAMSAHAYLSNLPQ